MTQENTPPRLEDVFAGELELTATERGFLERILMDTYMSGGWCPPGINRRDFIRGVAAKITALPLHRMVTPCGTRLVSVEEHAALVADLAFWQVSG